MKLVAGRNRLQKALKRYGRRDEVEEENGYGIQIKYYN